jgi:hypothetical protein
LGEWFSQLSKGAKWLMSAVLAAGAIATAIGAIAALWPDGPPEPAELGADLSHVSIDPDVTLDEYALRQGAEVAWAPRGTGVLAAEVLAQAEPDNTTVPEAGATGEQGDGDGSRANRDLISGLKLTPDFTARVNEAFLDALSKHAANEVQIGVGDPCKVNFSGHSCGMNSVGVAGGVVTEDGSQTGASTATIADRMALILAGTRTRAADEGRAQLLGATVNFDVTLRGFRDRKAAVGWSLFDARAGGPPPPVWLKGQVALWLEGQAQTDSGSGTFWVPLPESQGPFFVRVAIYDEDGDRLDYEDTESVH